MTRCDYLIIGTGIAGAAVAHALRGRDVLAIDMAPDICSGASGNPKGIIRPFFSLGQDSMRDFYEAAYFYALEVIAELSPPILQNGVLQLPKDGHEKRFASAPERAGFSDADLQYLSPRQATDILQTECLSDALYWPRALVVNPVEWSRALFGATRLRHHVRIVRLEHHDIWHAITNENEAITARNIIVTSGTATQLIPQLAPQLRPRMGQISMLPSAALPALPHALSFGHYFIPSQNDEPHVLGATYEHTDVAAVTADGHQRNIAAFQNLAHMLPMLEAAAQQLSPERCTGRAAVRATTKNHLPLYGRAAENLFYLTGLGSRGLMSAPYAAHQLCKMITGLA